MTLPPHHHKVATPVALISGEPGGGSLHVTLATIARVTFIETEESVTVSYHVKLSTGYIGPAPEGCDIVALSGRSWDSQSIGEAILNRAKPPAPPAEVAPDEPVKSDGETTPL